MRTTVAATVERDALFGSGRSSEVSQKIECMIPHDLRVKPADGGRTASPARRDPLPDD